MSRKLELENLIFARAARLGVCVDGVRGGLRSASADACLQAYLNVYNAFFALQNRAEYLEEDPSAECWLVFDREARRLGPCSPGAALYKNPLRKTFSVAADSRTGRV